MTPLLRRLLAETVGTGLLVTVVIGSGIAAQRLSPDDVGLQLLANSTATVFGLAVLILLFGPVSGAHFNPVVSAADWLLGRSTRTGLAGTDVLAYTGAQILGAILGAILSAALANGMYGLSALNISQHHRFSGPTALSEVVATAGLIALIFALARTGRGALAAPAVGAYIGAAYWFTSSTSFANPAVTIGRIFSDTFAGIAPASVPGFVIAQVIGAALGAGLVLLLYPDPVPVPKGSPMTDTPNASGTSVTKGAKPSVLFVCVHNAGRSQMAAGWLAALAGDAIDVRSAGTAPKDQVNPVAVEAMREVGIDITTASPKVLIGEAVQASDVVITMGCGDACPYFPGTRYLDWVLNDPAGQGIETVRPVRDEIKSRVEGLISELLPEKTTA